MMHRRTFVKTLSMYPLLVHCASSSAVRKDVVWLDMNQTELDAAYDQRVWASNAEEILMRYKSRSEAARDWLKPVTGLPYGSTAAEKIDFFRGKEKGPIHIFIHGGAWAGGAAKDYSLVAQRFVEAGAHVVIPDFASVKDVGGDLGILAEQVRKCIQWTHAHASEFGGDPNRIFISGHSSGAHLAAVALSTDWPGRGLPFNLLKGGLLLSGMYDLKPVRLSARREYIRFTDDMEQALSPQRNLQLIRSPLIIAWGDKESPEFQRQGKDFVSALQQAQKPVNRFTKNLNHFEILFALADSDGFAGQEMLKLMKLE